MSSEAKEDFEWELFLTGIYLWSFYDISFTNYIFFFDSDTPLDFISSSKS